jgi:NAD(P)-dependent dehydrogenase (short-subunit alcohol dehydrogenase family)
LITGASRGFGKALAIALAQRGWDLVIDARTEEDLNSAAEEIADSGTGAVTAVAGDVTDLHHVAALAKAARDTGRLDMVVNNASLLGPSPQPHLDLYPVDVLRDVLEVNLIGPLRLIQTTLPLLRETGGTIVNVTSDAAAESYEGWGGYGSSKAALEQMSNVLAAEEPGLEVYWFDPGDMNTRMHQEAFPDEDVSDRPLPEDRVPGLLALLDGDYPSGRYAASDFLVTA